MNVNKTIHEAMGLCWHEFDTPTYVTYQPQEQEMCSKCGCPETIYLEWPDYTSPVHYCALMDWMGINYRSRKLQVYCFSNRDIEPVDIQEWLVLSRQEQVSLIAEVIEEGVLK